MPPYNKNSGKLMLHYKKQQKNIHDMSFLSGNKGGQGTK